MSATIMQTMKTLIRDLRIALQFLTILPMGEKGEMMPQDLARTMAFFPVAGLIQGILISLCYWPLSYILPDSILAAMVLLLIVVSSGALHLDGLSDMMDGLGSRKDKEKTLLVMKDSRIGVFGAISLILLLLLKFELFKYYIGLPMTSPSFPSLLITMFAAAKWAQVMLATLMTAVKPGEGLGQMVNYVGMRELTIASCLSIAIAFFTVGMASFIALASVVGLVLLSSALWNWKLGGINGDIIGGTSEVAELVVLLSLIWFV